MPDLSSVDSDRLLEADSQLSSTVQSMTACIAKLQGYMDALDKGWTSSVKTDFMARYALDQAAMQEMLEQYREIGAQLREAAREIERTETDFLAQVKALG